jgi:hypothetical protein
MLFVNSTYAGLYSTVVFNLRMGSRSFSQILDILVNTINNTDFNSDKNNFLITRIY